MTIVKIAVSKATNIDKAKAQIQTAIALMKKGIVVF